MVFPLFLAEAPDTAHDAPRRGDPRYAEVAMLRSTALRWEIRQEPSQRASPAAELAPRRAEAPQGALQPRHSLSPTRAPLAALRLRSGWDQRFGSGCGKRLKANVHGHFIVTKGNLCINF